VTERIASLETIKSGKEILGSGRVQKRALWESRRRNPIGKKKENWEGQLFVT
jgi:hypothetical protein